MLLPDKMVSYKDSVFSKFVPLLQILQKEKSVSPETFYTQTKNLFSSLSEFIQTLDALYALGKINLDKKNGEIICL